MFIQTLYRMKIVVLAAMKAPISAEAERDPGHGLHPGNGEAHDEADEDDHADVEELGPAGMDQEVLMEDVVDHVGVDLNTRGRPTLKGVTRMS